MYYFFHLSYLPLAILQFVIRVQENLDVMLDNGNAIKVIAKVSFYNNDFALLAYLEFLNK